MDEDPLRYMRVHNATENGSIHLQGDDERPVAPHWVVLRDFGYLGDELEGQRAGRAVFRRSARGAGRRRGVDSLLQARGIRALRRPARTLSLMPSSRRISAWGQPRLRRRVSRPASGGPCSRAWGSTTGHFRTSWPVVFAGPPRAPQADGADREGARARARLRGTRSSWARLRFAQSRRAAVPSADAAPRRASSRRVLLLPAKPATRRGTTPTPSRPTTTGSRSAVASSTGFPAGDARPALDLQLSSGPSGRRRCALKEPSTCWRRSTSSTERMPGCTPGC